MKIYIAGPYSKGDVAKNVHEALRAAEFVSKLGHTPFVPHLTHFWHLVFPHPYDFWLAQDIEWLKECDALYRVPGESSGADGEMKLAAELGMIIYFSEQDIPRV